MKKIIPAVGVIALIGIAAYAQTEISKYPSSQALNGSEVFVFDQNGATVSGTLSAIKTFIGGGGGGSCSPCVVSFNSRTGAVSLSQADVTTALGYTPLSPSNNLSDILSPPTGRTNLGLGTAATANTGTSAGVLGFLNGNNTYSGVSTFTGNTASSRRSLNANTTLSAITDNFVCGDVSGGAITLTLPPNTIPNGTTIGVDDCKRQAATHNLTVAANTGQTISGSASITITTNGGAILAVWNSTDNDWNLF